MCQQGMHDMFIPSQHLATSSSSGVVQHNQKKRKADHFNTAYSQLNAGSFSQYERNTVFSVNGAANANSHGNSNCPTVNGTSDVPASSPTGNKTQTFVRASTIKLLDSYQRCGQKVCHETTHLFSFHNSSSVFNNMLL